MGNARIDQSLYSSVVMGSIVCTGYAKAFCAMTNALGVDTVLAVSDTHAWNVVHFDNGNYYAVDVCWNDTDKDPPYNNRYLNVGEADSKARDSKESHTYKATYANWIPAIAKNSYTPTAYDTAQKPAAPANIKTVPAGEKNARTSWDAVPGATGYEVCLYTDSTYQETRDVYFHPAEETGGGWNIAKGMTYYYGVRTVKSVNGQNVYSDWVNLSYTHT